MKCHNFFQKYYIIRSGSKLNFDADIPKACNKSAA